jgi:CDP-glycerol glycerophosphotransferase
LGLKDGEKLILFAPTYRKPDDNYFKDSIAISYGVDCDRVCKAMAHRFGGTWRFAYRLHPCVVNRDGLPGGDVMDLSDYPDMQELLLAADAMINDFSSSMWDFMLTGRPSFLFAIDLEHYIKTTQVYTPVEEWPFPRSTNNDDLEKSILNFDEDSYAAACRYHYTSLGGCETGKATELVCRRIYEVCFGKVEG